MLRTLSDLLFASVVACIAGLLVGLGIHAPIWQLLFGLPLALILPGYALTAAFFPPRTLGNPERLLFSVGLSLIVTILGSLALHWTHLGLQPMTWAILLIAITLVASLVAGWQRRGTSAVALPQLGMSIPQAAMLGLAAIILLGAIVLARIPSTPNELEGYTLLSILPSEATQMPGVHLEINCQEFAPVDYRLTLTLDDKPLQEWETIYLDTGQEWEATVNIPSGATGLITGTLYRLDNPNTVYRQVQLWYREP